MDGKATEGTVAMTDSLDEMLAGMVLPLRWSLSQPNNVWCAKTLFGTYYIHIDGGRHSAWIEMWPTGKIEQWNGPERGHLEQAQSDAEADYRSRIISALNPDILRGIREALDRANRTATDRRYMMDAYFLMLGPKGRQVAEAWQAKGVRRQHTSWGPEAAKLSGEERAQVLLDMEAAVGRPVESVDSHLSPQGPL